ncbi:GLPGLI family protein [Parapedobacter koreensis]|uniref:GLPGLI family protein n=1 Tax=Parapedobacter koreensis TaxID=332977 RepID=A0A1H7J7N9_9SPHI|nr:GLPGLI family protein [Parapedobacter koreensis]SEK69185.1 GLPGLI family protein [Parapedobacter koreensis]
MKTKIVHLLSCLFTLMVASQPLRAQYARFVESGVVEFEKRVNMYAKIKNQIGGNSFMEQAFEQYQKANPQFKSFKYSLAFGQGKTRFWPHAAPGSNTGFFGSDPSVDMGNTIFTDLLTGQSTSQKSIYEETYLITDSTRRIQWRLTNETREIAGYECRRANALVLDSVYVVAFYTDQIPVAGGPESFTGLPGLILGVALPYENTTYFATKVEDRPVTAKELEMPKKGKALNYRELRTQLEASLKNWGDRAQAILKAILL